MDKKTKGEEIALTKSELENELGGITDWFDGKVDSLDKIQSDLIEWRKTLPESGNVNVHVKDASLVWLATYTNLAQVYELLRDLTIIILPILKESTEKTTRNLKQIKRLKEQLKKHQSIITQLEQAFEFTNKVLDENR